MTARFSKLGFLALGLTVLTAAAAHAQAPARPGAEGIEVHGSWTITVTRDGHLVERREFQNALMNPGRTHLSRVMARTSTPGRWLILVEADGTGTLCADNEFIVGEDTDCAISEASGEATVAVTEVSAAEPEMKVVLAGTETIVRDGNISLVNTFQYMCSPTVTPDACEPVGNPAQMTRKGLDTPIPVQAGDRIEVQVVVSFS